MAMGYLKVDFTYRWRHWMSELNVVIADDEPLAISNLKAKLAGYPQLNIVACFDNGDDTLHYLLSHKVDLVFLDIQMPGLKGIDILKQLHKTSAMSAPLLVLVTAYEHYALPAFEHLAFDYLLKPVSRARLAQCLQDAATALLKTTALDMTAQVMTAINSASTSNAAIDSKPDSTINTRIDTSIEQKWQLEATTGAGSQSGIVRLTGHSPIPPTSAATTVGEISPNIPLYSSEKMLFRSGASAHLLDESDIMHIEAAGNYMCVQTIRQNLVVRETLKQLLKRLPRHFVQVHRSTLVNLHHVHQIQPHNNDYLLQLSNGKQVIASRRYKQNWQAQLYVSR
jgi:DNA-binding LytR/AlgR family response regulator